MGPRERRHREREELRNKILDAARTLFTEQGYEAVTMRKVAQKIEYSATTIYLHFKDKDDLIREMCTVDFLQLAHKFKQVAAGRDPLRRFFGIGKAFLSFAQEYPNHYRMMFMTPHPPVPVEAREIEKGNLEEDAWAILNDEIENAKSLGIFRNDVGPSEALAQLFFAGIHGIASLFVAKANDPWINWKPAEELAHMMVYSLLQSCVSQDAAVELNKMATQG